MHVETPSPFGSREAPLRPSEGEIVHFQMYLRVVPQMRCDGCGHVDTMDPVIVSPTWSKRVQGSPMAEVWRAAVAALKSAHQIVVVGYSMPDSDTFFQYMLGIALTENARLQRVVVVNPDPTKEFRDRFGRVFDQRFRGKFLPRELSFEDFVGEHLRGVARGL
jgi:hypothetical protein